jgi:N-formylglutamate amidohydrolase
LEPAFLIERPKRQTLPFVFASPHSGAYYPDSFIAASRLDPVTLRRSEDAFVDDLFGAAPLNGAPLLKATFPRAYVDPNREAWELDPRMFEDRLPPYVNTKSARVFAGLGTVARVVSNGEEIYNRKLAFAEVHARIEALYEPYHAALRGLIEETRIEFGHCILVDCHSMPSVGGPMDNDPGTQRVDFVLGNNHGATCHPRLIQFVEAVLAEAGYTVRLNNPYSGGFTTRHYGQPRRGIQTLQIEVNRALYMDEIAIEKSTGFASLQANLTRLVEALANYEPATRAAD